MSDDFIGPDELARRRKEGVHGPSAGAEVTPLGKRLRKGQWVKGQKPEGSVQWQPGQSGNPNGRPLGSRNRLSNDFLVSMQEAFNKYGARACEIAAMEDPINFLRLIVAIMPKQIDLSVGVNAEQFVTTFRSALEAVQALGNEAPQLSRRRSPKVIDEVAKVIKQEVIDVTTSD
jgi:hypothetical protein